VYNLRPETAADRLADFITLGT